MANQARNVLPLFSSSNNQRWRGAPHQSVVLIVQIQRPNPPWRSLAHFSLGPRLLLLLDVYDRFSSPLPTLFCCTFLPCVTTSPPYRFSPTFASRQLLLQPEIVFDVHTVLSLLLSLCLQAAATNCSSCCKWRAAILGRTISKFSNRKVQFPTPLGRKMVPLQQQRPATGAQRVRTA